jgi:Fe-S-cluster-containing hydrogenase component 2
MKRVKNEIRNKPGIPSKKCLSEGPVAVIECFQEIPCDPCEKICPRGAIKIGKPITNLPALDEKKCIGCGRCIPYCPGLAIFVINMTYSKNEALISFPYEFLPLPKVGTKVEAADRAGKVVTYGKIIKVNTSKGNDYTAVISIAVPKQYGEKVRGILRK